jgi:hypothetical protein
MLRPGRLFVLLLAAGATALPARALLTFDSGKDQVIVTGIYSFGYDSNIFASQTAHGSITQAFSASATYTRRAGIISVSASTGIGFTWYAGAGGQNFYVPNLSVTFAKGIGRTTGSLSFSAAKSDVPDPIANNRAIAWTYSSTLDLRYPVIERYYLTNSTGISGTYYTNQAIFSNLISYSDQFAINYTYDSKLDLNGSYRFDIGDTPGIHSVDQGVLVGANGTMPLLPKVTGTIDAGYEVRSNSYLAGQGPNGDFGNWTSDLALNWRYSRGLGFTFSGSKDLSVSSTDITTDTTSISGIADFTLGKQLRTNIGVSYVGTDFLGPDSLGRRDMLWEFPVNLGTALTTHIRVNLAYAYMINTSTLSDSSFTRETVTLSLQATY